MKASKGWRKEWVREESRGREGERRRREDRRRRRERRREREGIRRSGKEGEGMKGQRREERDK